MVMVAASRDGTFLATSKKTRLLYGLLFERHRAASAITAPPSTKFMARICRKNVTTRSSLKTQYGAGRGFGSSIGTMLGLIISVTSLGHRAGLRCVALRVHPLNERLTFRVR